MKAKIRTFTIKWVPADGLYYVRNIDLCTSGLRRAMTHCGSRLDLELRSASVKKLKVRMCNVRKRGWRQLRRVWNGGWWAGEPGRAVEPIVVLVHQDEFLRSVIQPNSQGHYEAWLRPVIPKKKR